MNSVDEVCLEKVRIFTNFCVEKLGSLPISKREFYYIWRYVLAELGVLMDECDISEKVKSMCREIDVNSVRFATHKILYAQYSSITNEEVMQSLARLCQCLKHIMSSITQHINSETKFMTLCPS
jgi:hypothetical protein